MSKQLLEQAAAALAKAREIKDRHGDKPLPKADAEQIDKHLRDAANFRKDFERGEQLDQAESWMAEPQHKHAMGAADGMRSIDSIDGGQISASGRTGDGLPQATKRFLSWMRSGTVPPEAKADLVEDATGLNLVPTDFAGTILKDLSREAVIRSLALIRPTSREQVDLGNVVVGTPTWGKIETGSVPGDGLGAPPADKDTIKVHDLTALVKIGRDELEDADANLEPIVRAAVAEKFAEVEDDAFAGGSGAGQPFGLVASTMNPITNGIAAAAGQTVTPDELKALQFQVAARFRRNAVYLADSTVEEQVSLMKDGEGRYLLQPNAALGEPPTLFGYRFYTVDGLPAVDATVDAGAGTDPSAVFGDLKAGYMIADRRRLTVQRLEELFAGEGKVGFLFTHRVGGDVIRPAALATLKL